MTTVASSTNAITSDLMAAVNPKTTTTSTSTDTVEADTNKFLTLLVTQLKNQDPLNPLDNAQLTSQLAQLSTVTGVNKLNTTLESLQTDYQTTQSLQASSMIGHGVLTAGNAITLSSGAAVYGVDLATAADDVKVNIRNSGGTLVKSIDLGAQDAGTLPLGWDGSVDDLNGTGVAGTSADGQYTFEVVATRSGEKLTDATALTFGTVASVSTGAAGVTLNVPAVGSLTLADIKQIL
jgi:flagellar basal-body rod modification protein FlgD